MVSKSQKQAWDIEVIAEQRTRVSMSRVRVLEICVVHRDVPTKQVTVTPPLLCIEILSPEDRLSRTTKRLDDLAGMGVRHLWIIDPAERKGYMDSSRET